MNIRFTIEEENIIAIYAEGQPGETTLEKYPCRHALYGRGYAPACPPQR